MMVVLRRWSVLLGMVLLSQAPQAQNWKLELDDDKRDIQVYTRDYPGSALKEFRGVMRVKTRLSSLVALIEDHRVAPQWIHQCRALDIIERSSADEILFYMVTAAPWPVQDRDSVVLSKLTQHPETLTVRIDMQVQNGVFPVSDDMVRITDMAGYWQFSPQKDGWVEVIYQVHANPGGGIPGWLINSLVVDTPFQTLKNMQKKVQEARYQQAELLHVRNPENSFHATSVQ